MKTRKVIVYEWQQTKNTEKSKNIRKPIYEKVEIGQGIFYHFGHSSDEYKTEYGNYSTAIIRMPNGEVANITVNLIKFIELLESKLNGNKYC